MPEAEILRVVSVRVVGPFELEVTFNDGVTRVVDLESILHGPVFDALREPGYFARVAVDPVCGTVTWPNGADLAPEALRDLDATD